MFSLEKVVVVVREVVKARVLCKKTCIGVHLSIQRWEYGYECNTSMNIHVLQEDSKEWDNQRDVVRVIEFENESYSGCHEGLWWLIMDEEDDEVTVNI
ncbi:hypothetical protein Tco_0918161 [Tanacetum coccineum]